MKGLLYGLSLLQFFTPLLLHSATTGVSAVTDTAVGSAILLETALAKPDPSSPWPRGSESYSVVSAKNEYESFLVVLNGPLHQVAVVPKVLTKDCSCNGVCCAICQRYESVRMSRQARPHDRPARAGHRCF